MITKQDVRNELKELGYTNIRYSGRLRRFFAINKDGQEEILKMRKN